MSYNTHTKVLVQNNFSASATIMLTHEYSVDGMYSNTWKAVPSGQSGSSSWQVGYNTGLFHFAQDYWSLQVVVDSGADEGVWRVETFQSTLHPKDANQILHFSVSPSGFQINKPSGDHHEAITKLAPISGNQAL